MTDSPDPVGLGQDLSYTLEITNDAHALASGVTVAYMLPRSISFVSASASQGACLEIVEAVTCALGDMGTESAASVTIVVIPLEVGPIATGAEVSSGIPDYLPADNTASERTTVLAAPTGTSSVSGQYADNEALPDLSITISDSQDPARMGETLTYTINVYNDQYGPASDVVVKSALPTGVTFVSARAIPGACSESEGEVSCSIGSMNPELFASVTIVVRPTVVGSITNRAEVSSRAPDHFQPNNVATESTAVTVDAPLPAGSSFQSARAAPSGPITTRTQGSQTDPGGVALDAVEGLFRLMHEKDARIDELEERVSALEATKVGFEADVWPPSAATLPWLLWGVLASGVLALVWRARRRRA